MVDFTLIGIFGVGMIGTCIQSVLAPFFPSLAKGKNVSSFVTGLIFSIQPAVAAISSPILGMMLGKIGRKRVLIISAFLLVTYI